MSANKKIVVISFQSLTATSGSGMARLGFFISKELYNRNILDKFIVYSKGKFNTEFPSEPVSYLSRYFLFIINKLNKTFRFAPHKFRFFQELAYDWFCKSRINKNIGVILVTQPYLKNTFNKAKKLGIPIIYIPGNPEENYIRQLLLEEQKLFNVKIEDAYTYSARIDYYNTTISNVDIVLGTYPTVFSSYSNSDYKGKVIEMIGHIKTDFPAIALTPKTPTNSTYKVGYLAYTVALKGLQYLLQAWDKLNKENPNADIELLIAGKIDDVVADYISTHHLKTIKITLLGHVSDLPNFYKSLDLFVVPSLIDGGPYTALEAAYYGLPVLITENCGSSELLSRNNSGCMIVPIRDADGLKNNMFWAYSNRSQAIQMGINAKYNLDTYDMNELVTNITDFVERELNIVNNINLKN